MPDLSKTSPTPGLGNAPIGDQYIGAGLDSWDLSVFKSFWIGESKERSFQIRAEAYNAFNHTQFSSVNATASFNSAGQQTNSSFGRYTNANAARQMQIAGKFTF